ncbi:MAG TPA: HAMP domain-containing sensor histidine kinase [Myxococcaceae bacterium]|nr:HAMP domain-containing sensor histidine kinase [Myxococcaceae bacterium]
MILLSAMAAGLGSVVTAWVSVEAARATLDEHALRTASMIASSRQHFLLLRLRRDNERAAALLRSAQTRCLAGRHREASRTCLQDALGTYAATEDVLAARLSIPGEQAIETGEIVVLDSSPPSTFGELARVAEADPQNRGPRRYVLRVRDGDLWLTVVFSAAALARMFEQYGAVAEPGDAFLVDSAGRLITPSRHPVRQGSDSVEAEPIHRCLSGQDGEMIGPDQRNVRVIHGYRYLPQMGGTCLMVHLELSEAFQPAQSLRRRIALFGGITTLIAVAVAIAVAGRLAGPLHHLTDRVRRLRGGDFDAPVPIEGPSEIRTLAATFQEMARAVSESRRARDEVLAVVSHDLKNPLSSIATSAGLLRRSSPEGGAGDPVRRHAALIEASASKMNALIADLLDVASLESGKLALSPEPLEPCAISDEVVDVLHALAVEKEIELRCDVPKTLPRIWVDRKRAYQVLSNVVGNAVKYTPGGGSVSLTAAEKGNFVQFAVRDTGPGIQEDHLARIFEQYWKRGPSGGTGLGLYIARALAEVQGGRIGVESAVGAGSTFIIAFPRAQS